MECYRRLKQGVYRLLILFRLYMLYNKINRRLSSPPLPKNKDNKIYIHLGCGPINSPDFINVDILQLPHVHYISEMSKLPMFRSNYADLIYASHSLEHIGYHHIVEVLKEWHRILKPNGVLRLSVPDFDKLIDIYCVEGYNIDLIMPPLMGGQDYKYNFHKTIFNRKSLTALLTRTGFRDVREWDPQTADHHSFEDWASRPLEVSGKKYVLSLNLEGIK